MTRIGGVGLQKLLISNERYQIYQPRKTHSLPPKSCQCHLFLHLLVHNSIPSSPPKLALAQSLALFLTTMGVRATPPYRAEECGMSPPQYLPPPPKPWFSWLVPLIFLANIAMFVLSMYINDCPAKMSPEKCLFYEYLGRFSFQPFKENPLLGPSAATLKGLGALERDLVVKKNEMWRLLSCMWFHAGAIHLTANMMSLLFIGIRLEQEFGFCKNLTQ
ncbi:hypothetical protein SLA2020_047530 [Shorea laevis]